MIKIFNLIFLTLFYTSIQSQNTVEEEKIKQTLSTFFNGLHQGDSTLIASVMHPTIKIQTTYTNTEGKSILKTDTKKQLLINIANKRESDTYFEKLHSYSIHVDDNLASVWTPYTFYYNNKKSHCGANTFQLFKTDGPWEIIYIADSRRKNNCTD